jgi:hypothetical protein
MFALRESGCAVSSAGLNTSVGIFSHRWLIYYYTYCRLAFSAEVVLVYFTGNNNKVKGQRAFRATISPAENQVAEAELQKELK